MADKNDFEIAEQKRKAALTDKGTPNGKRMIAALLRERSALELQGKTDRIKQVDEQLALYGYEPEGEESPKAPVEDPKKQAPQGRSATPLKQQTKD